METEYSSTIWPILYFEADWPSKSYDFDLDVHLIKADETLLEEITNTDGYFMNNIDASFNTRNNTQWFLAMHRPEIKEHISVNEIGISFIYSLQNALKNSFLTVFQLVRSTAAICPFDFSAEFHENTIDEIDTGTIIWGLPSSDKPDVYLPEIFEVDDLNLMTDLWSAMIKLRKFDSWKKLINTELFFQACDKEAGKGAVKKALDFAMSLPNVQMLSEEEKKSLRKGYKSYFKDLLEKGDEWLKEHYREEFRRFFLEKQEETFSDRTRIGRAINLFFNGIHQPLLHSFLSMCLVLETLYTIDEGETTYKLTTRLAKIFGSDKDQRKEMYKRAKKVYDERSKIVHGTMLLDIENNEVLKDVFFFARQGIRHVLLNPLLLELYSDPGTADKKVKGKAKDSAKNAIRDYFLDLDLQ